MVCRAYPISVNDHPFHLSYQKSQIHHEPYGLQIFWLFFLNFPKRTTQKLKVQVVLLQVRNIDPFPSHLTPSCLTFYQV